MLQSRTRSVELITEEQASHYYADSDASHGFDHVLRVAALAEQIAGAEGADLGIVRTAALLHDVGRAEQSRFGACHAELGARKARQILADCPPAFIEAVAHAIAAHRYRDPDHAPLTLEAKVLFDSDKLDAIGAIGVGRAFAMAGKRRQHLWSPMDAPVVADLSAVIEGVTEDHTPVQEYLFKLRFLKDSMFTATGRTLAAERHRFMVAFYERLDREVRGELSLGTTAKPVVRRFPRIVDWPWHILRPIWTSLISITADKRLGSIGQIGSTGGDKPISVTCLR